MIKNKKIKTDGTTLIELMIGVALSGLVAMATISGIQMLSESTKKQTETIENTVKKLGAEKVIQKDIYGATHSFNNVLLKDKNNREFFDYLAVPYCSQSDSSCRREVVLEITDAAKNRSDSSAYFLSINNKIGLRFEILPEQPYAINADGSIDPTSYQHLNWDSKSNAPKPNSISIDLTHTDPGEGSPLTEKSPWLPGELLLLFTNAVYTPDNDLSVIPKKAIILGKVSDDGLELIYTATEPTMIIRNTHPQKTDIVLSSPKLFLENLIAPPGSALMLYIEGVEFIRYHIERDEHDTTKFNLYRTKADADITNPTNGKLTFNDNKKILIYKDIKTLRFKRDSISSPVISYSIDGKDENLAEENLPATQPVPKPTPTPEVTPIVNSPAGGTTSAATPTPIPRPFGGGRRNLLN